MVELDAAGQAALGEEAELGDDELVELDLSDAAESGGVSLLLVPIASCRLIC
jgi:hypothetical protein